MLSAIQKSKSNIKMTKLISFVLAFVLIFSYAVAQIDDWCIDSEDYFVQNCPIQRGDYNGCCLCTQYYYYSCGKKNILVLQKKFIIKSATQLKFRNFRLLRRSRS